MDVILTICAAITQLALAILGAVMTLRPPKTTKAQHWYFWSFVAIGLMGIAVVGSQSYRAQQVQRRNDETVKESQERSNGLIESLRDQISDLVKSSTKPPLAVQVLGDSVSGKRPPEKPQSTPSKPPDLPPPVVSEIRFTERRTDSPKKEFPYALQVIIQTNVTIQPTAFKIECDNEIAEGSFFVSGQSALMNVRWGTDHNVFFFSFGYPPFMPESSVVATLLSKSPIRVKRIERVRV